MIAVISEYQTYSEKESESRIPKSIEVVKRLRLSLRSHKFVLKEAVNYEYTIRGRVLTPGKSRALIPPFSSSSVSINYVKTTTTDVASLFTAGLFIRGLCKLVSRKIIAVYIEYGCNWNFYREG